MSLGVQNGNTLPGAFGNSESNEDGVQFKSLSTLVKNALMYISAKVALSDHVVMAAADADAIATVNRELWVNKFAVTSGDYGIALPARLVENVNTLGATIGDPVYASGTAGGWTLTKPGLPVRVGEVLVVSATVGVIVLAPQKYGDSNVADRPTLLYSMVSTPADLVGTGGAAQDFATVGTYSVAASLLALGRKLKIRCGGVVLTSVGATAVLADLTVGGQLVGTTESIDAVDNKAWVLDVEITPRAAPGAAVVCSATSQGFMNGTANGNAGLVTIATNGALVIAPGAGFDASDATSCRMTFFTVELL